MEIPNGYCACGCGKKTWIATKNCPKYNWIKGQPVKYLVGHHRLGNKFPNCTKGEKHGNWRGGTTHTSRGYKLIKSHGHPRADKCGYIKEHILIAEKVLGKSLPLEAVIHHHTPNQLIVCQDQAYHLYIHQREKAYRACGHANWRKCQFCKQYDGPNKMYITKNHSYHNYCINEYHKKRNQINSLMFSQGKTELLR
jgi:hypothetical protein